MPQSPKRKCNEFGCRKLTRKSYCPVHEKKHRSWSKPNKNKGRGPDGKKIYDQEWRNFREEYLSRAENALCRECKKRNRVVLAKEIDHIIPLALRPDLKYDDDNLQPLCTPCHSRKTAYEVNAKRKKKSGVIIDA